VARCRALGVEVGAHPGYDDRPNLGRVELPLTVEEIEALADQPTDLDEPEAEGVELHTGNAELDQPVPECVQEPVGRGVQQEPELIGPEGMIAQPVGKAGIFEVFDPEFGSTTALDLEVIEGSGVVVAGGDHKADVETFGKDFGLDDDPTSLLPTPGGILGLAQQAHLVAGLGMPFGCCG